VFFGNGAALVAAGLVAGNLVVLAALGVLLSHTLFRGQHMPFIMELPLYHAPNLRTITRFAWSNTVAMVRKAGRLIVLMSVLVWALAYFPGSGLEQSYLARFGHALAPVGDALGMDWRMLTALLSSFIAKENAIATLGVLYGPRAGKGLAEILAGNAAAGLRSSPHDALSSMRSHGRGHAP
jgi:ferrous iron transport protein B